MTWVMVNAVGRKTHWYLYLWRTFHSSLGIAISMYEQKSYAIQTRINCCCPDKQISAVQALVLCSLCYQSYLLEEKTAGSSSWDVSTATSWESDYNGKTIVCHYLISGFLIHTLLLRKFATLSPSSSHQCPVTVLQSSGLLASPWLQVPVEWEGDCKGTVMQKYLLVGCVQGHG